MIFENESSGPGRLRCCTVVWFVVIGQNDDFRLRMSRKYGPRRYKAVHRLHFDIHYHPVGMHPLEEVDGFSPIDSVKDGVVVRDPGVEKMVNRFAHAAVIFGDQESHGQM